MSDNTCSTIFSALTAFFTGAMFFFCIYKHQASRRPEITFSLRNGKRHNNFSSLLFEVNIHPASKKFFIDGIKSKHPDILIAEVTGVTDDSYTFKTPTNLIKLAPRTILPEHLGGKPEFLFLAVFGPGRLIDTLHIDMNATLFGHKIAVSAR